jgi:hyperosmotically inducible protein
MFKTILSAMSLMMALGFSACQSTTGKTAGQTMTDSRITAAVQSKLTADRMANFARVDVDTERGVVNLSGIVPSTEQKDRAETLTRQVEGVKRINNNLQVQR